MTDQSVIVKPMRVSGPEAGHGRTRASEQTSAVKFQTVDDLVDHLALGAHGEPDQIEVSAHDGLDDGAVRGVVWS